MTGLSRGLLALLLAGWLADELARVDRDVEAGIEAYESGELDSALARVDAAIERHGDQPELSFNRGLVLLAQGDPNGARRAFERASEAEDLEVRSSAFYERGNVAFDAEEWDAAIEAYTECLKARPDHANAKWNLELALQRKEQQEDEDEDEDDEEEQDEDDGGTGGEDSGSEGSGDSTGDEDSGTSTGGEDPGTSTGGGGADSGSTGDSGDDEGDSGDDEGGSGETGGQDSAEEPPPDGEQEQDDEGGEPPEQDQPPPQPLDQMDIDRALEDLDAQDNFPLDRPVGGRRPPAEDW